MRVVVLGKGLMLANIILGLKDAGAEIVGVFRYDYTQKSRLRIIFEDFFAPAPETTLIKQLKLNQIRLKSANSSTFRKLLLTLNIDLIVVGTWKELIAPETYNIPRIATVNIHPSLLPKYRGPNPYIQTILHGEKYSGVTIHLMNDEYDAGAVLKQEKIIISPADTSKELRYKTVSKARELVRDFYLDLNHRILTPIMQDNTKATYFPNISGEEMMLDFTLQTSDEISRTIRALHPFLPAYITFKNVFFRVDPYNFAVIDKITKFAPDSVIAKNSDECSLTIVCRDNKAIKFNNLKLYKKRFTRKYIEKNVDVVQ